MAKATGNLQDSFLNQLRKDVTEIEIVFLSGGSLRGTVRGFDNFTIIVKDAEGHHHLVYKHAVAHIVSPKGVLIRQSGTSSQKATKPSQEADQKSADTKDERSSVPKNNKEPFNRIDLSQIKQSKS